MKDGELLIEMFWKIFEGKNIVEQLKDLRIARIVIGDTSPFRATLLPHWPTIRDYPFHKYLVELDKDCSFDEFPICLAHELAHRFFDQFYSLIIERNGSWREGSFWLRNEEYLCEIFGHLWLHLGDNLNETINLLRPLVCGKEVFFE